MSNTFLTRLSAEMKAAADTAAGKIAIAAGWEIFHTGGGCLAWSIEKTLSDGTAVQALVSNEGHEYDGPVDDAIWSGQVERWHEPSEGHAIVTTEEAGTLADTLARVRALFDTAEGIAPPPAETAPLT
jgi:hypothetical protein